MDGWIGWAGVVSALWLELRWNEASFEWNFFCLPSSSPHSTLNIVWNCKEQPEASSLFKEIWGEAMRCERLGRWSSRFSASLCPPPQQWATVLAKRWFLQPWSENKPTPPTKSVPRTLLLRSIVLWHEILPEFLFFPLKQSNPVDLKGKWAIRTGWWYIGN